MDLVDNSVDVLLGIFRPSAYLREQIISISQQSGAQISLIISIDSERQDLDPFLPQINQLFPNRIILDGPKRGAAENYFYLLKHSKSKFVAFCDQDDIWEHDHIEKSLIRLAENNDKPSLTFSPVLEFGKGHSRIWPKNPQREISSIIFENPARGCTIVLNEEARLMINTLSTKYAIMHDWFSLLVVSLTGSVIYSERPEVRYRLHDGNAIGRPSKWKISRLLALPFKIPHPAISQFMAIIHMCEENGVKIDPVALELKRKCNKMSLSFQMLGERLRMSRIENVIYMVYLFYLLITAKIFRKNLYEYI
jgi:glycosyltransferase involved in cell wall biosynthesis